VGAAAENLSNALGQSDPPAIELALLEWRNSPHGEFDNPKY
jgi:hypothetical protein